MLESHVHSSQRAFVPPGRDDNTVVAGTSVHPCRRPFFDFNAVSGCVTHTHISPHSLKKGFDDLERSWRYTDLLNHSPQGISGYWNVCLFLGRWTELIANHHVVVFSLQVVLMQISCTHIHGFFITHIENLVEQSQLWLVGVLELF